MYVPAVIVAKAKEIKKRLLSILFTRKYPLRGYILGLGAPGTPGIMR